MGGRIRRSTVPQGQPNHRVAWPKLGPDPDDTIIRRRFTVTNDKTQESKTFDSGSELLAFARTSRSFEKLKDVDESVLQRAAQQLVDSDSTEATPSPVHGVIRRLRDQIELLNREPRANDQQRVASSSTPASTPPPPSRVEPIAEVAETEPGDEEDVLGLSGLYMFHFLFPELHAREGKGSKSYEAAKDMISAAQSVGLGGSWMLGLLCNFVSYILENKIQIGSVPPERLEQLFDAAARGRLLGNESTKLGEALDKYGQSGEPIVVSFAYGGHQTYIRLTSSPPRQRFRLDYFDRQRQDLHLRGKPIPGYFSSAGETRPARPMWFDFDLDPAAMSDVCANARVLAGADAKSQDEPRRKVLEYLADKALDYGVAATADEPAQPADAINCAWASLESVVGTFVGADGFEDLVYLMRRAVVIHTLLPRISRLQDTEEERAVRVGLDAAATTDTRHGRQYAALGTKVSDSRE